MRRNDVPPDLVGIPLATGDALQRGINRSRMRAADVVQPFRGVLMVGELGPSTEDRCRALLPLLRQGWAFSHWTAAELHGGALPHSSDDRDLDVAVIDPSTPPRRAGVRGHKVAGMWVQTVRGLPVASPADVWVQLASVLRPDDLVALGDSFLPARRRLGVATFRDIVIGLGHRNHSYGIRAARRALPLLREGVDSRMETLLRFMLVKAGLPEPEIGHAVDVGRGVFLHPDLAYVADRIAIEYEGEHHRTDSRQWHHDLERQRLYELVGWRQLRVSSDALFHHPRKLVAELQTLRGPGFRVRGAQ